jgi:tetratricopeptide (TPR) repeat protein
MVLAVLAAPAAADRITLSNGRVVEGRVLAEEADRIQVEINGMQSWLSRDRVVSVEASGPGDNLLLDAEAAMRRSDVARALEMLERARREGAACQRIDRFMAEHDARISAEIFRRVPATAGALRGALVTLSAGGCLTTGTLVMTARHLADLEEPTLALDVLDRLRVDDFEGLPQQRAWVLGFLRGELRRLLDRGDFERGLGVVERIKRLDGGSFEAMPLADLARAAAARDQGRFQLAIEILVNDVRPRFPEVARNRVAICLASLRAWATATRRFDEALEAIAPLAEHFPLDHQTTRNALVVEKARQLIAMGDAEGALAAVDAIPFLERNDEQQEIHRRMFHVVERARLMREGDPLDLMRHARWCAENGMAAEALEMLAETRQNANLRELSDEMAANIRRDRDTRAIEDARRLHGEGRHGEALAMLQPILLNPGRTSQMDREAQALRRVIEQSMRRDNERRPFEAMVLFQRAERAYFAGDLLAAVKLLQALAREYDGTPAAAMGVQLQPDVLRSIEMAMLEGRRLALPSVPDATTGTAIQRADRLREEMERLMAADRAAPIPNNP